MLKILAKNLFQDYSLNMAGSQCEMSACQSQQFGAVVKVNMYAKERPTHCISINPAILQTDYRQKILIVCVYIQIKVKINKKNHLCAEKTKFYPGKKT